MYTSTRGLLVVSGKVAVLPYDHVCTYTREAKTSQGTRLMNPKAPSVEPSRHTTTTPTSLHHHIITPITSTHSSCRSSQRIGAWMIRARNIGGLPYTAMLPRKHENILRSIARTRECAASPRVAASRLRGTHVSSSNYSTTAALGIRKDVLIGVFFGYHEYRYEYTAAVLII